MLICIALGSASYVHTEMFATIDDLKEYSRRHPVVVPIDNQDYLNPQYDNYLQATLPTNVDKILMALGLKKKSLWKPQQFIELMRKVTHKRKKDGMRDKFVQRIEVSKDDHFLVWGNLQGSFHSLVCALDHLVEQKIMDKNLKIIADKYFIVFAGNVIDRSVYSLETLAIVLRLLDINPTRVLYAKGDHEVDKKWFDFDLRKQLEFKVAIPLGLYPPYPKAVVPYTDDIEAFFDTLPLVSFLCMKTVDNADAIRVGHLTRKQLQFERDELQYIFNKTDQAIFPLPIVMPKNREDEKPAEVVAMTSGHSSVIPNYNDQGLRLLVADQGSTCWSILSAQNDVYEKLYNFVVDSYADITIALPMRQTTIVQHYQDAKNRTGFKLGRVYNMFSGQADEQFKAQPTITVLPIGNVYDGSGETAMIGSEIRGGLGLSINKQNQQGIASGTILSLIMLDDSHILAKVRRYVERLINKKKVKILLGVAESLIAKSYYDLVKEHDITVFFPFTSWNEYHSPSHANIIHYGPSYTDEADILMRYAMDMIGPNKIVIMYQTDEIGQDAIVGVRAVCEEKGFKGLIEFPIDASQLMFKDELQKIQRENPDVIGIFCSSNIAQEIIRQVGVATLSRATLLGLSSFGSDSFKQYYKRRGLRIVATNLIPDPLKSDLLIAQDYRKEAAENNVVISPQTFEAYIYGSLLVEAIRITKGEISPKAILKTLESMKNYDFKGLKLTFNPEKRELSDVIWIDPGNGFPWEQYTARKYKSSSLDKMRPPITNEKTIEGSASRSSTSNKDTKNADSGAKALEEEAAASSGLTIKE